VLHPPFFRVPRLLRVLIPQVFVGAGSAPNQMASNTAQSSDQHANGHSGAQSAPLQHSSVKFREEYSGGGTWNTSTRVQQKPKKADLEQDSPPHHTSQHVFREDASLPWNVSTKPSASPAVPLELNPTEHHPDQHSFRDSPSGGWRSSPKVRDDVFAIGTLERDPTTLVAHGKGHVFRDLERRDIDFDWKSTTKFERPVTPVNVLGPLGPLQEMERRFSESATLAGAWNVSTRLKDTQPELDTEPMGPPSAIHRDLASGVEAFRTGGVGKRSPVPLDTTPHGPIRDDHLFRSLERKPVDSDWKPVGSVKK
jgi:hypothetical protein